MFSNNYLEELLDEKDLLDPSKAIHSLRLLDVEIENVRSGRHIKPMNSPHGFQEEIIRLSEKIVLPVQEFPRFNFVGKILGPKGSTLRGISYKLFCFLKNITLLLQKLMEMLSV